MPDAMLVMRTRATHADGVIEMVVWRVPRPVPPSTHPFKYRLVFIRDGLRVVGYDNERGKGDHRHTGSLESLYRFSDIDRLIADFMHDVETLR